MTEFKKIRVREGKARDVGLFRKLWKEYLLEQQKEKGSIIKGDSDKNLEIYTNVFRMYTDPELSKEAQYDGVVLFISEVAVFMAGDPGNEIETILGRRHAYVWGVYVVPDQRDKNLDVKLYEEGAKRLKDLGFDSAISSSPNEVNLGVNK